MKLSLSRYRSVLLVQISLLVVDLLINTFCEYLRFESVILLVVFVIQDVCLVFSLIIVFLSFFSTYIFQAGLVGVLVQQFRTPIIVTVIYIGMLSSKIANKRLSIKHFHRKFLITNSGLFLGLSIAFHVWSLHVRWLNPMSYWWTDGLVALFVIQRFTSALYYYYYKRTALRITDPRFYEDLSWIQNEWGR